MTSDLFSGSSVSVAKRLLGCVLVHETKEGRTSGRIVETESYLSDDPAAHSFGGLTARNAAMFGKAGTAYVYFTYGMHFCFNVVTNKEGVGEAVLIRALEPVDGLELMRTRRKQSDVHALCSGPAKLVQAIGITPVHNGVNLAGGPLRIEQGKKEKNIGVSKRVGISKGVELPLRFIVKGSRFVSHLHS